MGDKIVIGVPRGHFSAPWDFFNSLYRAIKYNNEHELSTDFFYVEGSIIEENRNKIWEDAKRIDADWLLMVDDDMVFDRNSIYNLYQTAKNNSLDIVCGLFYTGEGRPAIYKGERYDYYESIPDRLFEVGACGMAFTLFNKRLWRSPLDFKREYPLGEDISFCRRAKEKGFKIWCDPTVKIGHLRLQPIAENISGKHVSLNTKKMPIKDQPIP